MKIYAILCFSLYDVDDDATQKKNKERFYFSTHAKKKYWMLSLPLSHASQSHLLYVLWKLLFCFTVALNYQTEDVSNFYNFIRFSENGSCGYVLKPDILRSPTMKFNPKAVDDRRGVTTMKVRVISGQHIPKAAGSSEVVDPYIEVRVRDEHLYTQPTFKNVTL